MSVDLRTRYLGLDLRSPLVVSACTLTRDLDNLRRMEEHGAAAAVLPSLFEEQIERDEMELHGLYESGTESYGESLSFFPEISTPDVGPDGYLRLIEDAKRAVSMPIIGSLNGITNGGWVRYAKMIQEAGADALELNMYLISADVDLPGGAAESRLLDLVAEVRASISIPLAVKLTPFFTCFANFAHRVVDAGADALVIFNRFVHPDIDLDTLTVKPQLVLSAPHESRLPLTWLALLRGRLNTTFAATTGVHSAEDVIKLLLAGADATMVASTLYRAGIDHLAVLEEGLCDWLFDNGYESVEQMKGSLSQQHCPDPVSYERVGYMKTLASFSGGVV